MTTGAPRGADPRCRIRRGGGGGDDAAFDAAHARVKTSLAKEVFARDERLKRRLVDMLERIEKEGLEVLASADAKASARRVRAPDVRGHGGRDVCARASAVGGRKAGPISGAHAAMTEEEKRAHGEVSKLGGGHPP